MAVLHPTQWLSNILHNSTARRCATKRAFAVLFALVFLVPVAIRAQEWSDEQRELWDWEEAQETG
jgi:hypothetical protein